jgi:uncharacterized protein
MIIIYRKTTLVVVCIFLLTLSWSQSEDSLKSVQFFYPNGLISSEGSFLNGQPDGVWKSYYSDSKIKSIVEWRAGQLEGYSQFFSTTGFPQVTYQYSTNLKNGIARFYDSTGILFREVTYRNDTMHGPAAEFYSNGSQKMVCRYEHGIRVGRSQIFSTGGKLEREIWYEGDSLVKEVRFNLLDSLNRKQGFWRETDEQGRLRTEGNYRNNLREGQFVYYLPSGRQEKIVTYESGIAKHEHVSKPFHHVETYHANGVVASSGLISDTLRIGVHHYYDTLGHYLFSHLYEAGVLAAKGKLVASGEKDSIWTYYFPDGQIKSTGKYNSDGKTGKWNYYFSNGTLAQQGVYNRNLPDGNWLWYYQNGQLRTSEYFLKGKIEGEKVEYDSLGGLLTRGYYVNDLQEGEWYYKVGDHEEKGAYQMGLLHGLWLHYYDNGQLAFKGVFKDGEPDGKHKFWYFHGRLLEKVNYKRGVKHGRHVRYYPNGEEEFRLFYKNGRLVTIDSQKVNTVKE